MKIGSLYTVKKYFWLLFLIKDVVFAAVDNGFNTLYEVELWADYWSRQLKCEVTYFSPETLVVFLEENGKHKKVLTSDGRIGWVCFDERYNDCFEEVLS